MDAPEKPGELTEDFAWRSGIELRCEERTEVWCRSHESLPGVNYAARKRETVRNKNAGRSDETK
jgi:hypothetical protein